MEVLRLEDAVEALARTAEPLAAAGAEGELAYGILDRLTREPDAWGEVTLMLGVCDGEPAALASMTGEHPALISGFTDPGRIGYGRLVQAMLGAGRRPELVNGSRRFSEPFAGAWAEVAGVGTSVSREMRAFELHEVRRPVQPDGRFRVAVAGDIEQLAGWAAAFGDEIDEPATPDDARAMVVRLTGLGDLVVWERAGEPVSMAAVPRRTPWSSAVSLVYTPPALRGNGFASATVAELSQRELDAGKRWCSLFTDLANPTSNHIYAEVGYRPAADFRAYALTW